jgi:hypothetical protein
MRFSAAFQSNGTTFEIHRFHGTEVYSQAELLNLDDIAMWNAASSHIWHLNSCLLGSLFIIHFYTFPMRNVATIGY